MAIPSIDELLGAEVSDQFDDAPVPKDDYNAILTDIEVRKGAKGPYLNIRATIFDGDYAKRNVWGISSFSERAITMPGGVANLTQVVGADIDRETPSNEVPAALAQAAKSAPVVITVSHEQVERNGAKQENADGTPEMRARIANYGTPSDEFLGSFETEIEGGDDDLPF